MDYREYPPAPDLAPFLRCFWTLQGTPEPGGVERILPDGRQELVFHLGDPFHQISSSGERHRQPHALYVGQSDSPVLLQASSRAPAVQRVEVFGVCFPPAGASAFFPHPQHETAGRILPLEDVSASWARSLTESLRNAESVVERIAIAESFLRHRLLRTRSHPAVNRAVGLIQTQPGLPVSQLASYAGCTSRHLERAFLHHVGIAPKTLARVVRFQRVLHLRDTLPRATWTQVALDAGYYDQAHLIADFRHFTGVPPTLHAAEFTAMERAFARLQKGNVGFLQDGAALHR